MRHRDGAARVQPLSRDLGRADRGAAPCVSAAAPVGLAVDIAGSRVAPLNEEPRQRAVHTQQEIAHALARRGIHATQATVSRDIQELGLVRSVSGYRSSAALVRELVLSVELIEPMAVMRTPPGTANLVARRIDEAARYVPLADLAISTQCGFASVAAGNLLSEDDQWRKLELVVDTAHKVWGHS